MTVSLDIASISHLRLRILTWNALEADIPLKQVLLLVDMEGLLLLLVVEGDMQEGHILSLQGEDFELILYMEPQLWLFVVEGMQVVDILWVIHLHQAWQL